MISRLVQTVPRECCGGATAADSPSHNASVPTTELTANDLLVINAVFDHLLRVGRWPSGYNLDRTLDRDHGLEIETELPAVPNDLLIGVPRLGGGRLCDAPEIGLTVAGIIATGRRGRPLLNLFLAAIRWAADLERHTDSRDLNEGPTLSSTKLVEHLNLSESDRTLIGPLGSLLQTEQWGWKHASRSSDSDWSFEIDRDVRRFRGIATAEEYWAAREAQPPPRNGSSPQGPTRRGPSNAGGSTNSTRTASATPLSDRLALVVSIAGVVASFAGRELLRVSALLSAGIALIVAIHLWKIKGRLAWIAFASVIALGAAGIFVYTLAASPDDPAHRTAGAAPKVAAISEEERAWCASLVSASPETVISSPRSGDFFTRGQALKGSASGPTLMLITANYRNHFAYFPKDDLIVTQHGTYDSSGFILGKQELDGRSFCLVVAETADGKGQVLQQLAASVRDDEGVEIARLPGHLVGASVSIIYKY